jgi:hypothetical protein
MNNPSDSEAAVLLREGRLAMELELDAACLATRIPAEQIKALEEGRYADLPGPAYARAFARTLAQAYGIDSELVVAAVRRDLGEKPDESAAKRAAPVAVTTRFRPPAAPPEAPGGGGKGKSRGPLLLVAVLGLALVALIGLTRLQGDPTVPEPYPAAVSDSVQDTLSPTPAGVALPDTTKPVPAVPPSRFVTVSVRDTSVSAFLLYIRGGRVRKSTLHGLDTLVLDPDTTALFRNLSTYPLRLKGAVAVDSLAQPYFRVERRGDSVRVVVSGEDAWKTKYDEIMDKRAKRPKKEDR